MPKQTANEVHVEACRNGQCWQAQLPSNPSERDQYLSFQDNSGWNPSLRLRVDPASWNITAIFSQQNYADVAAGDVLKLTFTDADGQLLYTVTGTSGAPTDSYPNGRDCDPSPCRQALAAVSQP